MSQHDVVNINYYYYYYYSVMTLRQKGESKDLTFGLFESICYPTPNFLTKIYPITKVTS